MSRYFIIIIIGSLMTAAALWRNNALSHLKTNLEITDVKRANEINRRDNAVVRDGVQPNDYQYRY